MGRGASRELPALSDLTPPPRRPHAGTPVRRPRSVRRTAHLNATYPAGLREAMHVDGICRDLVTPAVGDPVVADTASLHVEVDARRTVLRATSDPFHAELEQLVGRSGGGGFRRALADALPEEKAAGTPLFFLLDDMPGITLLGPSGAFMFREVPVEIRTGRQRGPGTEMADICAGWRADGGPFTSTTSGLGILPSEPPALELDDGSDPWAWHDVGTPPADGPMMRRRRRIDVTAGDDVYLVNSMFRDAKWSPEGQETGIHEYGVHAVVDAETLTVVDITADPRVLPFETCPSAARNADILLGEPLATLRERVIRTVVSTDGCTHLNDALRALAEVPVLVAELARVASGAPSTT